MKARLFISAAILVGGMLTSTHTNAQYKKASFLNKGGRTHGISFRNSFLSKAHANQLAIAYSIGKERDKRHFFTWQDFEFLLPTKYRYNTETNDSRGSASAGIPIEVKDKVNLGFIYRYNMAYYVMDNSNEANKILPFVTVGFNVMYQMGVRSNNYPEIIDNTGTGYYGYSDLKEAPMDGETLSVGANAGVGVNFKISSGFSLIATGGYNFQTPGLSTTTVSADKTFTYYSSHPYAGLTIRFRIND